MKIAKQIKAHLDTISGKRRITILRSYIKEQYKDPSNAMRNVGGEYSPNMIIDQLNLMVAYVKNLCANNGKALSRYYSYTRIQEIEVTLGTFANNFEGVDKKSSKATLRNILLTSTNSLDILKNLLGPFSDIRFDSAIENLTKDLSVYQESLLSIEEASKNASKHTNDIQRNLNKAEKSSQTFDSLTKDIHHLQKELELQKNVNKEINDKAKIVSKHINKLQTEFEDRIQSVTAFENDMIEMRNRIQEEYTATIDRAREFEGVAVRVEQIEAQTKNIIGQAQHALNVSQGAGFLDSYKDLYKDASRIREFLPWGIGATLSFLLAVFTITITTLNVLALPGLASIVKFPKIWAEFAIIPIILFCFFFCMAQLKYKQRIRKRYQARYASLETYLNLSEHLPYNSPEQLRTVSHIMRFLEEDFNPIAIKAMFNAHNQFSNSIPMS